VGVEGVVSLVNDDEAGEAELFQDLVCALVLFCGEEGSAQSLFQVCSECRLDHQGLYRERAPGLDHAQLAAEGRHLSVSCILKTFESIAAASASPLRTASMESR
jgi:hypothetical protein